MLEIVGIYSIPMQRENNMPRNREELFEDWRLAQAEEDLKKVEPLE